MPLYSHAETDFVWDRYKSETDMYVVEFPGKPTIGRAALRVDPSMIIYSEQMNYTENPDPKKPDDGKKDYVIRMDQTFGKPFDSVTEIPLLLEDEIKKLVDFYTAKGGKIMSTEVTGRDEFEGRTLMVDLANKEGTPMAVRAIILMKSRTKVLQIVTAPKSVIERAPVAQFFHSLTLFRGEPIDNGELKKDWVLYNLDGRGLFNVRLPPGAPPFIGETPKIQTSDNIRTVGETVTDPVLGESLVYKATVYDQGNSKITESIFDLFLKKYHIEQPDKILIERVAADSGYLHGKKIWTPVTPTAQNPEFEEKIIRGYYTNNYFGSSKIVVVELTGSKKMLETDFAQNLLYSLTLRGDTPLLDGKAARQEVIKPHVAIDLK